MHSHCPTCGVKYERETGYFLNSMFIAYTLGFLLIIPLAVLLYLWDASILVFTLVVTGFFVVVWPVIFRYRASSGCMGTRCWTRGRRR